MASRLGFTVALLLLLPVAAGASSHASASWRPLPQAPIAPGSHTSVWTGKQLLVFGRRTVTAKDGHGNPYAVRTVNVAAAYDPTARTWRRLSPPAGPASAVGRPAAVWTGRQMLVWNAFDQESYDPLANRWRRLPAAPTTGALVVWTGRSMIGWGGGCCGDAFSAGSAYTPATNRWAKLPRSPLAGSQHPVGGWTGRRLLVVVGAYDPDGRRWPARLARAASYDPSSRAWRRLAAPPSAGTPTAAAWDGRELLVLTTGGGFAYSPRTNAWRTLPPQSLGATPTAVWARDRLLVTWGRSARAYEPGANRWTRLPRAPLPPVIDATSVWTGRSLLVFGTAATKTWGAYRAAGASLTRSGEPGVRSLTASAGGPVAHEDPQLGSLVVPGDRVEIGYRLDGANPSPSGTLYVRSARARSSARLPLAVRRKDGTRLVAVVPRRLLVGDRLFYYAVVRGRRGGPATTVPATGARRPSAVWVLQRPTVVRLGTHRFGHTHAPGTVVARAAATDVGWDISDEFHLGPQTFVVARDRSVVLQDSFGGRLLVWEAGRPDTFARSLPLPGFAGQGDVAVARNGDVYASAPGNRQYAAVVYELSPSGAVLRKIELPDELRGYAQLPLRFGPDGTLYCGVNTIAFSDASPVFGWMPVVDARGRALSTAEQRRRILWGFAPLAGARRLVTETYLPPHAEGGPHEGRVAIVDARGHVVAAWRILSRTEMTLGGPPFFTPELVGGDPVVDVEVARPGTIERVVLRLTRRGTRVRFSLPYLAYGDDAYADLRIGPDGALYQLAASPAAGVRILRYGLGG